MRLLSLDRSLSDIAVRDEAKEVRPDARPQARKNRRCISRNTLRIFSGRARRRWWRIVRRSRKVNVAQAPRERHTRKSLFIWLIWFVLFIWFICLICFIRLVWFNQINKTNQTNQTNETDQSNQPVLALHAPRSVARTVPNTCK